MESQTKNVNLCFQRVKHYFASWDTMRGLVHQLQLLKLSKDH
jgi:hypothetical protein